MPNPHEILNRLASRDRFSLAEIHRWITDASDLETEAAVYQVLSHGWKFIRPEPDMDQTCEFMTRHLLHCIHVDSPAPQAHVPSGYESAHHLAACIKHWAEKLPVTDPVLLSTANMIADAYIAAGTAERDRLLNGLLEHALESVPVRPYFKHWQNHPLLAEPWRLAMEWAIAHDDPAK